jgi:hypothetical protein
MNQAVRHTQLACLQASQPISLVNKLPVMRALPHFSRHIALHLFGFSWRARGHAGLTQPAI